MKRSKMESLASETNNILERTMQRSMSRANLQHHSTFGIESYSSRAGRQPDLQLFERPPRSGYQLWQSLAEDANGAPAPKRSSQLRSYPESTSRSVNSHAPPPRLLKRALVDLSEETCDSSHTNVEPEPSHRERHDRNFYPDLGHNQQPQRGRTALPVDRAARTENYSRQEFLPSGVSKESSKQQPHHFAPPDPDHQSFHAPDRTAFRQKFESAWRLPIDGPNRRLPSTLTARAYRHQQLEVAPTCDMQQWQSKRLQEAFDAHRNHHSADRSYANMRLPIAEASKRSAYEETSPRPSKFIRPMAGGDTNGSTIVLDSTSGSGRRKDFGVIEPKLTRRTEGTLAHPNAMPPSQAKVLSNVGNLNPYSYREDHPSFSHLPRTSRSSKIHPLNNSQKPHTEYINPPQVDPVFVDHEGTFSPDQSSPYYSPVVNYANLPNDNRYSNDPLRQHRPCAERNSSMHPKTHDSPPSMRCRRNFGTTVDEAIVLDHDGDENLSDSSMQYPTHRKADKFSGHVHEQAGRTKFETPYQTSHDDFGNRSADRLQTPRNQSISVNQGFRSAMDSALNGDNLASPPTRRPHPSVLPPRSRSAHHYEDEGGDSDCLEETLRQKSGRGNVGQGKSLQVVVNNIHENKKADVDQGAAMTTVNATFVPQKSILKQQATFKALNTSQLQHSGREPPPSTSAVHDRLGPAVDLKRDKNFQNLLSILQNSEEEQKIHTPLTLAPSKHDHTLEDGADMASLDFSQKLEPSHPQAIRTDETEDSLFVEQSPNQEAIPAHPEAEDSVNAEPQEASNGRTAKATVNIDVVSCDDTQYNTDGIFANAFGPPLESKSGHFDLTNDQSQEAVANIPNNTSASIPETALSSSSIGGDVPPAQKSPRETMRKAASSPVHQSDPVNEPPTIAQGAWPEEPPAAQTLNEHADEDLLRELERIRRKQQLIDAAKQKLAVREAEKKAQREIDGANNVQSPQLGSTDVPQDATQFERAPQNAAHGFSGQVESRSHLQSRLTSDVIKQPSKMKRVGLEKGSRLLAQGIVGRSQPENSNAISSRLSTQSSKAKQPKSNALDKIRRDGHAEAVRVAQAQASLGVAPRPSKTSSSNRDITSSTKETHDLANGATSVRKKNDEGPLPPDKITDDDRIAYQLRIAGMPWKKMHPVWMQLTGGSLTQSGLRKRTNRVTQTLNASKQERQGSPDEDVSLKRHSNASSGDVDSPESATFDGDLLHDEDPKTKSGPFESPTTTIDDVMVVDEDSRAELTPLEASKLQRSRIGGKCPSLVQTKRVLAEIAAYRMEQDDPDAEVDTDQDENDCAYSREESPITEADACYYVYLVKRKTFRPNQTADEVEWITTGTNFTSATEANQHAAAEMSRERGAVDIWPLQEWTCRCTEEECGMARWTGTSGYGTVMVEVDRVLRTFHDGRLPDSKRGWLKKKLYDILVTTTIKYEHDGDVFEMTSTRENNALESNTGQTNDAKIFTAMEDLSAEAFEKQWESLDAFAALEATEAQANGQSAGYGGSSADAANNFLDGLMESSDMDMAMDVEGLFTEAPQPSEPVPAISQHEPTQDTPQKRPSTARKGPGPSPPTPPSSAAEFCEPRGHANAYTTSKPRCVTLTTTKTLNAVYSTLDLANRQAAKHYLSLRRLLEPPKRRQRVEAIMRFQEEVREVDERLDALEQEDVAFVDRIVFLGGCEEADVVLADHAADANGDGDMIGGGNGTSIGVEGMEERKRTVEIKVVERALEGPRNI